MNIENRSGMSMFVVLTFMFVSLLLGSAMLYMSKNNIENQGSYYQIKTAQEASESALDWFQALIQKSNPDTIVDFINKYNSKNKYYYSGNSSNFDFSWNSNESSQNDIIFNKGSKYSANLVVDDIDSTNMTIKLHSIGMGKNNSQKTIHAVYKLNGIGKINVASTTVGAILDKSFYSDGNVNFECGINANKSVYIGGAATLKQKIDIDGDLKIMSPGKSFIEGDVSGLTGNLYVEGDVQFRAGASYGSSTSQYIWVDGKTSFNGGVSTFNAPTYLMGGWDGQAEALFNENVYIDSPWGLKATFKGNTNYINGDIVGQNNMSFTGDDIYISGTDAGNRLADNGGVIHLNSTFSKPKKDEVFSDPTTYSEEKTIDIKLGQLRQSIVDDNSKGFETTSLSSKLYGSDITKIYNGETNIPGTSVKFDKTKNDVLTIVVNDLAHVPFGGQQSTGPGKLGDGVKVAFVIDADVRGDNCDWYGSTTEKESSNPSNCGIFVGNGSLDTRTMNFGDFRGMIHMGHSDMEGLERDINVDGAFITKGELDSKKGTNITYNNDAIMDFYEMGIFKNEDGTDYKPGATSTTMSEEQVKSYTNKVKAILISKY